MLKRHWRLILVLLLFIGGGIAALIAALSFRGHPEGLRSVAHWRETYRRPLSERIVKADSQMLGYLLSDNRDHGITESPEAVEITDAMKKRIADVLKKMPGPFGQSIANKLAAITVVKGLGSGGYTETLLNDTDEPVGTFLVLDQKIFDMAAGEYAGLRDNSAFSAGPYHVSEEIRDGKGDPVPGLDWVMIHELAHTWAVHSDLLPDWNLEITEFDFSRFRFLPLSWRYEPQLGRAARKSEPALVRADLHFFSQRKLDNARVPEIYAALAESPYLDLYASATPFEDLSQSVTFEVLSAHGGCTRTIQVQSGSTVIREISDMNEALKSKLKILDKLLE